MLPNIFLRLVAGARGRVIADGASRVWNGLLSFALLPVYLHLIGAESFGVVSTFASVQAVIALFDCSLAPSLTRELARARAGKDGWVRIHDLTRTMEVVYCGLALLAGAAFCLLVPVISNYWLNPGKLTSSEVSTALYVGALGLVFQWPSTLYNGGMVGLQKQPLLALFNISTSTARAAITIFCLWAISPSVETLFWVGAVLSLIQTLIVRRIFWRSMPAVTVRGVFRSKLLSEIWRFAFGVSTITVTSVILLQADKVILSKLLSLEDFGYYTISIALANALFIVTGSIFSVTFPMLTELATASDRTRLNAFYHQACQGVSIAILPISAVIAFFSPELLLLWTRNPHIAAQGHMILTICIVGNVFNCLLSLPYTIQLAFGWTRVAIISNFASLLLVFPLILLLFPRFGSLSGPITWSVINFGLLVAQTSVLHHKALRSEAKKWYLVDAGLPLLASFLTVAAIRQAIPALENRWTITAVIFGAWFVATLVTITVLPDIRRWLLQAIWPRQLS